MTAPSATTSFVQFLCTPFGEGGSFAVLTPIEKFEDYDKPPLVSRMLSGDALQLGDPGGLEARAHLAVTLSGEPRGSPEPPPLVRFADRPLPGRAHAS